MNPSVPDYRRVRPFSSRSFALKWVTERQSVSKDKDSGIINDANLWSTETMGYAKNPLDLFQRVITLSLATMKIVHGLPKLDI